MNESIESLPVYVGPVHANLRDLTGQKFGRLTAESRSPKKRKGQRTSMWNCLCECGKRSIVCSSDLRLGHTRSCGCLQIDICKVTNRIHGLAPQDKSARPIIYSKYQGMIGRCYDKKDKSYHRYGGRGITVCDRWRESVENFLSDMGHPPQGLSLDRIDNNGPYSPENCRWATYTEQNQNRRDNRWVEIDGERHVMTEWARIKGIGVGILWWRLNKGWTPKDAIMTPVRKMGPSRHKSHI